MNINFTPYLILLLFIGYYIFRIQHSLSFDKRKKKNSYMLLAFIFISNLILPVINLKLKNENLILYLNLLITMGFCIWLLKKKNAEKMITYRDAIYPFKRDLYYFQFMFTSRFIQVFAGISASILMILFLFILNRDMKLIDIEFSKSEEKTMYTMKIEKFEKISASTLKETETIFKIAKRRLRKHAKEYSIQFDNNKTMIPYLDSLYTEITLIKLKDFCTANKVNMKMYEQQYRAMNADSITYDNAPVADVWNKLYSVKKSIGKTIPTRGNDTIKHNAILSYENTTHCWNNLSNIKEIENLHYFKKIIEIFRNR